MSHWHRKALEKALNQKGWRIVGVEGGQATDAGLTWQLQRSTAVEPLFLEIGYGWDWLGNWQSFEKADSAKIRGFGFVSIEFSRTKTFPPKLEQFLMALDALETERRKSRPPASTGGEDE